MNLNQITIPSLNLEKAVEFYTTLGLKLIVDSIPRYARFECPDGEATFSIHHVEALPKGDGITIYFEDKHLDEWVKKLQQKGLSLINYPKTNLGCGARPICMTPMVITSFCTMQEETVRIQRGELIKSLLFYWRNSLLLYHAR